MKKPKFDKEKMVETVKNWAPKVIVGGFAVLGLIAVGSEAYDLVMFDRPRTIKGNIFVDDEDKSFGISWVPKDRFGHEHESKRQRLMWKGENASEEFADGFKQVNAIIKGEQKEFTE